MCSGRLQKHLQTNGMLCQVCTLFNSLKCGHSAIFYCPDVSPVLKNISPFGYTCLNAAEEKEPYEEMARDDKKRYKLQVNDYKNPQPMMVDSGNESDS